MQISKILVPTDGSEAADRLYAYAMDLARLTGAAIVVMHAYNPPAALRKRGALALDELKSSLEEEARELVGEAAQMIQAAGLTVSALVVEGAPAEAILRAIEAEQPDLVVVGSRGLGGWPGAYLGSVAERVVRHAPVPVLVVK